MDDISEEEKQNYLRENILDKGYDAEDFISFLVEKKGDEGVNIGLWSFDEIKSVVNEYIQIHQKNEPAINKIINSPPYQQQPSNTNNIPTPNQIPNQFQNQIPNTQFPQTMNNNLINNNMIQNQNINQNINQNFNQNNSIPINNNNLVYNQVPEIQGESSGAVDLYGITNLETILCSLSDKSDLGKIDKVNIQVTEPEKIDGGFFTKAYITYLIKTNPLNLSVRRRYSDFEWLRQILLVFFSSSIIPPIPKKNKLGGDKFNESFLLKRMRTLEKFLNYLIEDPVIKNSQILFDFLSIESEEKFIENKKTYQNYKQPKFLRDFKSIDGKLDIAVNEQREINFQNLKDNAEINEEILSRLNYNLKQLNTEMNIVTRRLDDIAKICEELFQTSIKYYDTNDSKISYYQMNDIFRHWSNALKKQTELLNIDLREYFKYVKNNFRSTKEFSYFVEKNKQNYYKSLRSLIAKKEELFSKSDLSKWDLGTNNKISIVTLLKDRNVALPRMLTKETGNVINLKQIYGYYLNRANSEFERLRNLNGFKNKEAVQNNCKKQLSIITELFKNISDIAMCNNKYDISKLENELNAKNNEINNTNNNK